MKRLEWHTVYKMWQNHGPVWWQIWPSIIYSVFFSLLINFIWVLSLNSTELMFLWNILNIKISIPIIYGAGIYIYNVFHITLATTEFHSLIYCLFIYSDKISLPIPHSQLLPFLFWNILSSTNFLTHLSPVIYIEHLHLHLHWHLHWTAEVLAQSPAEFVWRLPFIIDHIKRSIWSFQ